MLPSLSVARGGIARPSGRGRRVRLGDLSRIAAAIGLTGTQRVLRIKPVGYQVEAGTAGPAQAAREAAVPIGSGAGGR